MATDTATLPMQGRLAFAGEIRKYILGGNSTFTLVSKATGQRFTYKVKSVAKDRDKNWSTGNQDRSKYFVMYLSGPDNTNDFQYMGMMDVDIDGAYRFHGTAKSRAKEGSKVFDAFAWFWNLIEFRCQAPSGVEFWHEGTCCMCGRKLTVPESVADGIGPECRSKVGL